MTRAGIVAGLVLLAVGASAADVPLAGKKAAIHDSLTASKRSVAVLLAGTIDLTGVDPTQSGATVTLSADATGYVAVVVLAAEHWTKKGKPGKHLSFRYKDATPATARLTGTKLKVAVHGATLPAFGGALGGVTLTVDAGALRVCGHFGGKIKKNDPAKFIAVKAPAPSACPPAPTTTTTIPAPPVLGTQIDRDGRPAISAFIVGMYGGIAGNVTMANTDKDAYNDAADPSGWSAAFDASFRSALAVWDGLDTVCGNQLGAGSLGPSRYATLAAVLVDDQLFVDTTTGTCADYLHLEQGLIIGAGMGTDCGGRPPGLDVIDPTYSLLVTGAPSGIGDGVASDGSSSTTTFPFLGAPTN